MRLLLATTLGPLPIAAMRWRRLLLPALAAVMFSSIAPKAADARVAIDGTVGAIEIDAQDSSIAEVLTALNGAFGLRYRSAIVLNQPVTGTFRGPMREILSHLLNSYDFVVKNSGKDGFEVSVFKFVGKDSERVISTLITSYPDPLWQARSYSRATPPIPPRGQHPAPPQQFGSQSQ